MAKVLIEYLITHIKYIRVGLALLVFTILRNEIETIEDWESHNLIK